ncbi:hypothetical protein NOF53_23610 [Rhodococcus sp. FXJ9.536]|uniref:Uncharacterized protein n=1 Tax=Rhodococcus tibetensis TaxID=2965064 RepID=A0ABT1QLZ3_9NOCA|nr:hypothetical protein [Rhodococcus sp. FXJ9.536]MCQ4122112.1 hypothetical protein [Rhodococcus sp. FXJ9.536]
MSLNRVNTAVNLDQHLDGDIDNVKMVTCGGQATVPVVHAVPSRVERGGAPAGQADRTVMGPA